MTAALLTAQAVQVLVLVTVDGRPARAEDVWARTDQRVELYVGARVRTARGCRLYTAAPRVKTRCRRHDWPAEARVTWFKVEPDRPAYNNVPGGTFRFASIGYEATRVHSGPRLAADVAPAIRRPVPAGGTMRFSAEVRLPDGRRFTSRAPPAARPGGPTKREDARRVTLRASNDYLGYLLELGGVPYIYGSAWRSGQGHQAERGIGVDCADLMIYGLRRLGHDVPYTSSRGLAKHGVLVAGNIGSRRGRRYLDDAGRPVAFGRDGVRPGDWLLFEGHVAALYEDRGEPGWLDEHDLIVHTAWAEVTVQRLEDSGYGDRVFSVRRPRLITGD